MYSFRFKFFLCLVIFLVHSLVLRSMDEEGPGLRSNSDQEETENTAYEFLAQRPGLFAEKLALLQSSRNNFESCFNHPPVFNSKGDYFGNLDDPHESISAVEIERILETFSQVPDIRKLVASMGCLNSSPYRSAMQVVLEGPPGTGKTTLSKALAAKAGLKYRFIDAEQLFTTYKNSSSDGLHKAVEPLLAQSNSCVLIIDEFTRLTEDYDSDRNQDTKTPTTLWRLLDRCRVHSKIFFIGLTNDKNKIPKAVQSRLQLVLHLGVIDLATRKTVLRNLFKSNQEITFEIENDDSYISFLAQKTDKVSLRDLDRLMDGIFFEAEGSSYITKQHVDAALNRMGYLRNPIVVKGEAVLEFVKDLAKQSAPYVIPWALNTLVQIFLQKQSFEQQIMLATQQMAAQQESLEFQKQSALLSHNLNLQQFELNNEVRKIELTGERLQVTKELKSEVKEAIVDLLDQGIEDSKKMMVSFGNKS